MIRYLTRKDLRKFFFGNEEDGFPPEIEKLITKVLAGKVKLFTTSYNYKFLLKEYEEVCGRRLSQEKDSAIKEIISIILPINLPTFYFLLIVSIVTVISILIIEKYLILNPFLQSDYDECIVSLTADKKQAYAVLKSCKSITDGFTINNYALNKAHKNAGRADLLVYWETQEQEEQYENKKDLIKRVISHFHKAENFNNKDKQAKFYSALMEDFKDFVLTPNELECKPASERYKQAITLYSDVQEFKDKQDIFILLELGHFLVSRDKTNGFKKAIELYRKAIESIELYKENKQTDENLKSKKTKKNLEFKVLLSLAKAQLLIGDYKNARDSFEKALEIKPETYQIKYYIGNTYALEGNFRKAIKLYEKIIKNESTKRIYRVWRDLGFAYYLLDKREEAQKSFKQAKSFQESNQQTEINNKKFIEKFVKNFDIEGLEQSSNGKCSINDSGDKYSCFRNELEELQKKERVNPFKSIFTVHEKDKDTDPFLDVEHDAFYKCRKEPDN